MRQLGLGLLPECLVHEQERSAVDQAEDRAAQTRPRRADVLEPGDVGADQDARPKTRYAISLTPSSQPAIAPKIAGNTDQQGLERKGASLKSGHEPGGRLTGRRCTCAVTLKSTGSVHPDPHRIPATAVVPSLHSLPLPLGGEESLDRPAIRAMLDESRERTLALNEPVAAGDMDRVHDPLMSPLVWDMGHIAAFEDLWLEAEAGRRPRAATGPVARVRRGGQPARVSRRHAVSACGRRARVPGRASAAARTGRSSAADPDPWIWDLVIRHEQQHNETMLQTLKLAEPGCTRRPPRRSPTARRFTQPAARRSSAGPVELGAGGRGFAYDNERPRGRSICRRSRSTSRR